MPKHLFYKLTVLVILAGYITGCATVSFDQPKTYSQAFVETENTAVGQYATEKTEQLEGLSGFYPLKQGMDALGMRLYLAENAEMSIDLQYFLMKNDTAGAVVANALLKAADRGVRVRFLLDDVFTTVPDDSFLFINQHPNIEIRIFNPVSRKGISAFNFVWHFDQANRRMHNKSFTVDNAVSIVGGRNIADEYFELKTDSVFVDFDVLAVGPIATEISSSFDEYWNHSRAVPIEQFIDDPQKIDLHAVRGDITEELDEIYNTVFEKALNSQLFQDIAAGKRSLFAGSARVLSDSPDKLVNEIDESQMQLVKEFSGVVRGAETEVVFISPYYVPGEGGVQLVRDLTEKGVRVIIFTNSLASNNHVPVHSAYAGYRKDVIRAGAELYEARANAARILSGSDEGPDTLTLHTKAFLIDRRQMFVGSLNLDPRSIEINAEMGVLIDSPEMVDFLMKGSEERIATLAYRIILNEEGKLEWHTVIDGKAVVETKEPLTNGWLRFKAWFMKIAPESQL